jgi:hypothetical protein
MAEFKTIWFWDSGTELIKNTKFMMSFYDDKYEKPGVVSGIKQPDHSTCHSFNYLGHDGNLAIALVTEEFDNAPRLWYVKVYADNAFPPMRSILAFNDGRFSDGTVLEYGQALELDIAPSQSCGLIRWFKNDSSVQQIFVSEEHRRKRISTKLFAVADIMIVADTHWNGIFLNGGHVTTDDGEALRSKWQASGSTRLVDQIGSVKTA